VAPLGSAALIFNFIFAKMLVGTNIERKDILGTLVVVASVIWIVVFGGISGGDDRKQTKRILLYSFSCMNATLNLFFFFTIPF
jgi:uncharacterized membrane protein